MSELKQARRISLRLTPWQARQLWRLRTEGLLEGQPPRTVTEIFVKGLCQMAAALSNETESKTDEP